MVFNYHPQQINKQTIKINNDRCCFYFHDDFISQKKKKNNKQAASLFMNLIYLFLFMLFF